VKYLHTNKIRIIFLFISILFVFKIFFLQEYIHLEQHKEKKISHDHCQQCQTIFHFGKFQSLNVPESSNYRIQQCSLTEDLLEDIYTFIFYKSINQSNFYNKPPPIFS
jgi:hypothetical protein